MEVFYHDELKINRILMDDEFVIQKKLPQPGYISRFVHLPSHRVSNQSPSVLPQTAA